MRGRQIRSFLVILGMTSLVWLAMAMSEKREYTLTARVKMTGFDEKRYAVVEADTSMQLQVEASGFNAFILGLKKEPLTFEIDMRSEAVHRYFHLRDKYVDLYRTVSVGDLSSQLSDQLSSYGIHYIGSGRDSLHLILNERASKVYRPDLSNLRINFSDGFGLYGEPMVTPTEVTLYGSLEVLEGIERLEVEPIELNDVRETSIYRVALSTDWKEKGDVYASTEVLTVNIPVKQYVERHYVVPVTVVAADTTQNIKLYPERVTLQVWVAQEDVASVSAEKFVVEADGSAIGQGATRMKLYVNRFPRNVRIKKVEPEEIEYVIIK